MPQKKIYTNNDIYKKVENMDGRIIALEGWREKIEIGKAAVDEYKKDEQTKKDANQRREVLKQVGIVLALVAAVLYVYLEAHGIHP